MRNNWSWLLVIGLVLGSFGVSGCGSESSAPASSSKSMDGDEDMDDGSVMDASTADDGGGETDED